MTKRRKGMMGGGELRARLQQVQNDLARAQTELAEQTVEASAGGGAVKVVMRGGMECRSVEIAPRLREEGNLEMIQDLVRLALKLAIQDAQFLATQKLGPLAGGLNLGRAGG